MNDRVTARVQALLAAHAKMVRRVQANPDHQKAEVWKAKALEYEASLESLKLFGKEVRRTNQAGVSIAVPVSGFSIKEG
jgi:hypothetical protein